MSGLAVAGLAKRFGKVVALDGVELDVRPGELFVILGPTNAGKSTLLKAIAGLVRPEAGSIALDGRRLDELPPRERNLSLLFQNNALFPTLTAFENLAFPLRAVGTPIDEIGRRVAEVAALLKVEHLLDRHPRTFSGGEQQRVAIGRAIIRPGALLMLDEPLANLDARLRIALRLAFKRMHAAGGQTMLYVTHDQVEAMSLADRIGVLDQGRFRQIGPPAEIYQRPATAFVARFVGAQPMNLLPATLEGGAGDVPVLAGAGFRVAMPAARALAPAARPRALAIGVRAEEIAVAPCETAATPFAARTVWSEHLGARRVLDLRLGDSLLKALVPRGFHAAPDQPVWIGFAPQPHRLLDRDSGRFLAPPAAGPVLAQQGANQGAQP
jgi:multiple sugar transport system ATP-binding protein